MRILLAVLDLAVGDGLRAELVRQGLHVDWVRDGAEAQHGLRSGDYAAAVIDLGLPLVGGQDALDSLRSAGIGVPVLALVPPAAGGERALAGVAMADDAIGLPVDPATVAERLQALLHRSRNPPDGPLCAGGVELDPVRRTCRLRGRPVPVSAREFELLHALMVNAGRTVTREQLEQILYAWGNPIGSNAIEVHVHHLRRKLGTARIRTVRGAGYRLARDDAER